MSNAGMDEIWKALIAVILLIIGGSVGYGISKKQIEVLQEKVVEHAQALGRSIGQLDELKKTLKEKKVESDALAAEIKRQLDESADRADELRALQQKIEVLEIEITGTSGEEAAQRMREFRAFLESSSASAQLAAISSKVDETATRQEITETRLARVVLPGRLRVLSNDHSSGITGQYFNFSVQELDAIFGHKNWNKAHVPILQARTGKVAIAVVWRGSSGGSRGDGHGRWDDGTAAPGQWKAQDIAVIFPEY